MARSDVDPILWVRGRNGSLLGFARSGKVYRLHRSRGDGAGVLAVLLGEAGTQLVAATRTFMGARWSLAHGPRHGVLL